MELINQFYHGDCCDVLKAVSDASVNLILTDPPFLTEYKSRDGRAMKNDKSDKWLAPAFQQIFRVLKDNSYCISFYGWSKVDVFMKAWRSAGFRPVGHFVFVKNYDSENQPRILHYRHEQAYLLVKGEPVETNFPLRDVLSFGAYTGNHLHPAQKPLQPLRRLIGAFTQVGDLVLDPLAGSGSTLVAAWQMERNYLGIELDQNYYEIARERLASEIARGQRGIIEHCLMQETGE
jgi:site-specific DNA-methyltransferase (adenine-specific)